MALTFVSIMQVIAGRVVRALHIEAIVEGTAVLALKAQWALTPEKDK